MVLRDLLHGFDYTGFYDGSDAERARIIKGGVNFLLAPDKAERLKDYIKESQLLHNALTLCRSLITQHEKQEVALMDAVRVLLLRFTQNHGPVTKQEINERIAALIEQSIQSTGVINLFETKREFSLFDEGFLEELRKMAAEIKKTEEEGNELGLNIEEKAFYDALTSPEGIRDAYSNDEFIALTKELTEQLRKNRTIDWNKKESARAKMRVLVKRLLKKYKYPPEGQEQALNTVMAQCNKWADEEENLLTNSSVSNEKTKVVGRKKAIEATFIPPGTILNDVNSDNDVRRLIHNMMGLDEGTTIMQIVVECQKEFQEKYFNMKGNDWRHLVRDYVRAVTQQPELQETEMFRFSMAG